MVWSAIWHKDTNTWEVANDYNNLWQGIPSNNVHLSASVCSGSGAGLGGADCPDGSSPTGSGTLERCQNAYYINGSSPNDHRMWQITVG